jgi:4-alpha-glucanotransferase
LDTLEAQGLLRREEYEPLDWGENPRAVSYERLWQNRAAVLRKAFYRFEDTAALERFSRANAAWLDGYALFMAIKTEQGGRSWLEWDEKLRLAEPAAMSAARERLETETRYHRFVQYEFFRQWHELRRYANGSGVEIIGDIPIYAAMDSADAWGRKAMFQLGTGALPDEVAGCPPDSFSCKGQLWGNPLYDWDAIAKDGFSWWIDRMRASFALYDVLRIDHFRGLESYYAIPFGSANASGGRWRTGPGLAFINAVRQRLPQARMIAEDLGFLTPETRDFLKESGCPGMKVLQFAFDAREPGDYSPYGYGLNNVVYTGTHDNDTALGWANSAPEAAVAHAMAYAGIDDIAALPKAFIRLALQNRAVLAIAPLQDWLGLGGEARFNVPSTVGGRNWRWRVRAEDLTASLAEEMRRLTLLYGRA